jgi:hypothetical protein
MEPVALGGRVNELCPKLVGWPDPQRGGDDQQDVQDEGVHGREGRGGKSFYALISAEGLPLCITPGGMGVGTGIVDPFVCHNPLWLDGMTYLQMLRSSFITVAVS